MDEPYGFSYDCGFPVEGRRRHRPLPPARGHRRRRHRVLLLYRVSYREIHTNPETGEWFSQSGHFANNEVGARRVEGSLFAFRIIKAGPVATIEDSDATSCRGTAA